MSIHSDAYRRWVHMAFPPGGSTEVLGVAKADLALRDGEIGCIIHSLELAGGDDRDVIWPVIDLLAEVDDIIARLTAFSSADDDEANLQRWQLVYATTLRDVYVEALQRRTR